MRNKIFCSVSILALVGCSTPPIKKCHPILEKGEHELKFTYSELEKDNVSSNDKEKGPNKNGLAYMSCTDKIYVNKLPKNLVIAEDNIKNPNELDIYYFFKQNDTKDDNSRIALSKSYFDMALIANNVYEDPKKNYYLPEWNLIYAMRSNSGLDMHVYGDKTNISDSNKIVFAFGGTEGMLDIRANIPFTGEPLQYKQAVEQVDKVLKDNSNAVVFATGHSLGGGIALNVAYENQRVQAVVFNPSPRGFLEKKR
ncbi:lipase family protein [Acinetobacter haemolyticus]|uniref:lipase family protein n=1 Tax=Acinetobacter haemolyticus TaxID=29430 RepID=UPI0002CF61E8|nr:hypothetical protein [Acinetobacter haemolyticus]ENW19935.1 hypothetical protein F926_02033 [Acinetobacter haemolyticus NIPH 261]